MGITVIIGFAESLSAPEVVWSLVDNGYKVMAFRRRGRTAAISKSRYVEIFEITAPEFSLAQAQDDLKLALAKLKNNSTNQFVLLPLDDVSALICGTTVFETEVKIAGPRGEAVDLALNKQKQIEFAQEAGFNLPWTKFIERVEQIWTEPIEFPVVFKSRLAVGIEQGRVSKGGSWICSDRAELESAVKSWEGNGPMVLQQFIVDGVGQGLFGLATPNGIVGWSGHQRLRMMNPHGSGASACISNPDLDKASQAATELFLQRVAWSGLFMIELLRDPAGKLWFIEFNGRAWGSMALARRGGFEYPAWSVQIAVTSEVPLVIPQASSQKLTCRHLGRELLHLLFVLRGSKSKALVKWPSFWKTCREVLRVGKNDRWYNWRQDDRRVFFSDFTATLRAQFFKSKA